MSSVKEDLWRIVTPIANRFGAEIFDIEMPGGSSGILRIYITTAQDSVVTKHESTDISAAESKSGVGISQCSQICREIIELEEIETFMPGDCRLEVSSPGINRKLRRPEHFNGAVGERVKITFRNVDGKKEVARGVLKSFDGVNLELDEELKKTQLALAYADIEDARVDFKF